MAHLSTKLSLLGLSFLLGAVIVNVSYNVATAAGFGDAATNRPGAVVAPRGLYGGVGVNATLRSFGSVFRCDGVSDDTQAFLIAANRASTTGATVQLPSGTCMVSSVDLTGLQAYAIAGNGSGNGSTATTLMLTGADSSACSAGKNGGLLFGKNTGYIQLRDLNISYNNRGRDCLINISHTQGDGFDPARIFIERVVFTGAVAGATTKAIFYDNAIEQLLEDSSFVAGKFQWNVFQPATSGGDYFVNNTFNRNQFGANITPANFQVVLGTGVVNLTFSGNNFENGPNGVDCSAASALGVNFFGNIFEDALSTSTGTWIKCTLSGSTIAGNQIFGAEKGIVLTGGSGNKISGGWIGGSGAVGIQDEGWGNSIESIHFGGSEAPGALDILEQGAGAHLGVNSYGSDNGVVTNSIELNEGSSGFIDYSSQNDSSRNGILNLTNPNAWQIRALGTDGGASILGASAVASDYFPAVIYTAAGTPVPACDAANNHRSICTSDDRFACSNGTAYRPGGQTACRVYCATGIGWLATGSGC